MQGAICGHGLIIWPAWSVARDHVSVVRTRHACGLITVASTVVGCAPFPVTDMLSLRKVMCETVVSPCTHDARWAVVVVASTVMDCAPFLVADMWNLRRVWCETVVSVCTHDTRWDMICRGKYDR